MKECLHCQARFTPTEREADYCCAGCRYVREWIHHEEMDRYYDLKGNRATEAVGSRVFEPADWQWADDLQDATEAELHLQGLSCVACAWLIEERFRRRDGALRIDIFPDRGKARLTWEPGVFSLREFAEDLARFGYQASVAPANSTPSGGLGLRLGLCGAFAMNTMAFTLPRYFGLDPASDLGALCSLVALASATFSVLVGGGYFFQRAWAALRNRVLHIDLPIALGIGAAYAASIYGWLAGRDTLFYVDFVATFTFLMVLGRWVQERALHGAQRRERGQTVIAEPLRALAIGDSYEVRPGGIVPVESLLRSGAIAVSLDWITGEPEPVRIETSRSVPAGARLLAKTPCQLQARESFQGSLLAQLLEDHETPGDPLLAKVLRIYILAVLVAAALAWGGWMLRGNAETALQVFVSILVVSCPCALGVSIPMINSKAARRLERDGIFIRQASLWNRLERVAQIAFDKTGTLTLPSPELSNPDAISNLDAEARQRLAELTAENRHPVARSLQEALGVCAESEGIQEEPGCGVWKEGWSLGKSGWRNADPSGGTVLARDGVTVAVFHFQEALRPDAREEIAQLQRRFGPLAILSGDQPDRVQRLAALLKIPADRALGGLSPAEKAAWLQTHRGGETLYLGDGGNDSLAFAAALCSGAPAAGSAVLESKADFCFLGRGLGAVRSLFETARRRRTVLRRLFAFAILYNAAAILVCLAGKMSPLLAATLMPLSSLATLGLTTWGWRERTAPNFAALRTTHAEQPAQPVIG